MSLANHKKMLFLGLFFVYLPLLYCKPQEGKKAQEQPLSLKQNLEYLAKRKHSKADMIWPARYIFLKTTGEKFLELQKKHQLEELRPELRQNPHLVYELVDTIKTENLYRLSRENEPLVKDIANSEYKGNIPFRYVAEGFQARKASKDLRQYWNGYKDFSMIEALLQDLHRRFPNHTQLYELGRSHQGRPIWALKISNNPRLDQDKPAVLFNGAHHGDEIIAPDYVLDIAALLLSALPEKGKSAEQNSQRDYGFDFEFPAPYFYDNNGKLLAQFSKEALLSYIQKFTIFCIPVVNPDGLNAAWTHHGHYVGRKNGRQTTKRGQWVSVDGVDLNRNYPFKFNSGVEKASSGLPDNYYYRGEAAGSEPESSAIIKLAREQRFVFSLSFHSAATKVIIPYSIDNLKNPQPDVAWAMGNEMAKAGVSYFHGTPNYVPARNLYPVDGTDMDWMYNELGILAYIIESPFYSPKFMTNGLATIIGMRPLTFKVFEAMTRRPFLTVKVVDANGKPMTTKIAIKEIEWFQNETRTTHPKWGKFYFVLPNAGTYTIVAEKDNRTVEKKISCYDANCQLELTWAGP